jgi:prepilin signal peptidase PulO-like enzyme (type II secretory pathway)
MIIILNIGIFLFGLVIGSFLNCIIYRLELREFKKEKKSFLRGKSFCPSCKHVLAWYDLIPIISFFILRRKCRYCKKKISIQYPTVELLTALIFLLILNYSNYNLLFTIYHLLIVSLLILIFVYDLKHFIIPDTAVFSIITITFLYNLIFNSQFLVYNSVLTAIVVSLSFLTIFALSKGRWMGFGDVKLVFFIGLFLGFPLTLVALFFSFLIGAIIGIILILLKKKGLKSEVPFGPFLIIGTYIGLFLGKEIIDWYLNLIII